MKLILLFFIWNLSYTSVFCFNILVVDNIPSTSHQIFNYAIVEALLAKGHNVTLLGERTIDVIVHENYSMYELQGGAKSVKALLDPQKIQHYGTIDNIKLTYDYAINNCGSNLKSPALKEIINFPKDFKFDLIIFDLSIRGCLLPLIQKFGYPPSIAVSPFLLFPYTSETFGNAVNPAYEPYMLATFSSKMDFWERLLNYFYTNLDKFLWSQLYVPWWSEAAKEAFGEDTATLDELETYPSVLLANIMTGFHYSRPLTPNIVPVGGLHIPPTTKLPQDIQRIIDNSKYGVIIFSLGTNVRTSQLDVDKISAILEAFSKLNQTILWKFHTELKNMPKNVIMREWLPQRDILAHPKTKLFISHCGGLSTMEAIHYGVPMVGIPFAVDQRLLAVQMTKQKYANMLEFKKITAKNLYNAVYEILHEPEYRNNVKRLSMIVRDQTETPLERAIFWIEYAIRHNGTHVLDPEARHLPLFITSSADIHLFLLLVLLTILLLGRMIILYLKSTIFCKKEYKIKIN